MAAASTAGWMPRTACRMRGTESEASGWTAAPPSDSFDPATGEKIGTYAEADAAEADRAVVVTRLAAVPFSVKPGGAAREVAVAGGLLAHGEGVAPFEFAPI